MASEKAFELARHFLDNLISPEDVKEAATLYEEACSEAREHDDIPAMMVLEGLIDATRRAQDGEEA